MVPDPEKLIALYLSCATTLLLFNSVGGVLAWLAWRKAKRVRERDPVAAAQRPTGPVPLFYVLSALLTPAAAVFYVLLIRQPREARVGAVCALLGIAQVMAIAWIVCLTIALNAARIVPYLP